MTFFPYLQILNGKNIVMLRRKKESVSVCEDESGRGHELSVEILPETADQGTAQELVHADSLAPAFLEGIPADIPVMHIQCQSAVGEFLDTDGIQGAGDRLGE